MTRILLALVLSLLASASFAACRGIDYRDQLTPQMQARLEREMQATPFASGNHWVATKGDRRIHVIGTMHGGDSRMVGVMRRLRPALRQMEAIYLEVTEREMEVSTVMPPEMMRHMLLPRGKRLSQMLTAETWQHFKLGAMVSGADPQLIDHLQPWVVSMFLVENGCRPYGFGLRRGLDDRIADFARRNRIPLGALETGAQALSTLSAMPLRDQTRLLEMEFQLMRSDMPEDATPVEAYFDQSVWSAFVLAPWISARYSQFSNAEAERLTRLYYRHLLDKRNHQWMKRILGAKQTRFAIAVGAAHLPGKHGVLNLLRAQGYQLSPAPW